jgi:hypothetical protein
MHWWEDQIRDEVLGRYGWTVKRFVDEVPEVIEAWL